MRRGIGNHKRVVVGVESIESKVLSRVIHGIWRDVDRGHMRSPAQSSRHGEAARVREEIGDHPARTPPSYQLPMFALVEKEPRLLPHFRTDEHLHPVLLDDLHVARISAKEDLTTLRSVHPLNPEAPVDRRDPTQRANGADDGVQPREPSRGIDPQDSEIAIAIDDQSGRPIAGARKQTVAIRLSGDQPISDPIRCADPFQYS